MIGHPLELDHILHDERNYAGWSFLREKDYGQLCYGSDHLNVVFTPTETCGLIGFAFEDEVTLMKCSQRVRNGILMQLFRFGASACVSFSDHLSTVWLISI